MLEFAFVLFYDTLYNVGVDVTFGPNPSLPLHNIGSEHIPFGLQTLPQYHSDFWWKYNVTLLLLP